MAVASARRPVRYQADGERLVAHGAGPSRGPACYSESQPESRRMPTAPAPAPASPPRCAPAARFTGPELLALQLTARGYASKHVAALGGRDLLDVLWGLQ